MKSLLRRELLLKRGAQAPQVVAEKSASAVKRLLGLPEWKAAKTVMLYASTRSEVQTRAAFEAAIRAKKRVCLPARMTEEHDMEVFSIEKWSDLILGYWGVLEPMRRKANGIGLSKIDLAVVPGVAFDTAGNRLGRGMHYYDGFLKKARGPIVALAFEMQMIPKVPTEAHDVPVHKIVTEKRVIECKNEFKKVK